MNLLLQLAEGTSVCGLVLLEELEDFLDALGVKLFTDGVQVVRLVLPELDLGEGIRMLVTLECALGVLFQDIFNLFGPGNDCA